MKIVFYHYFSLFWYRKGKIACLISPCLLYQILASQSKEADATNNSLLTRINKLQLDLESTSISLNEKVTSNRELSSDLNILNKENNHLQNEIAKLETKIDQLRGTTDEKVCDMGSLPLCSPIVFFPLVLSVMFFLNCPSFHWYLSSPILSPPTCSYCSLSFPLVSLPISKLFIIFPSHLKFPTISFFILKYSLISPVCILFSLS